MASGRKLPPPAPLPVHPRQQITHHEQQFKAGCGRGFFFFSGFFWGVFSSPSPLQAEILSKENKSLWLGSWQQPQWGSNALAATRSLAADGVRVVYVNAAPAEAAGPASPLCCQPQTTSSGGRGHRDGYGMLHSPRTAAWEAIQSVAAQGLTGIKLISVE